jgi:STELLO glycosyltransferases
MHKVLPGLLIVVSTVNGAWVNNSFSTGSSGEIFSAKSKVRAFNVSLLASKQLTQGSPDQRRSSCQNWAVITSIFPPTDLVRQLSSLPEWCTVVVGDKKSPPGYNADVDYLSPQAQETLNFSITPFLAWNHFGRKNIGFAYAVLHGAQFVYDTDDDNPLKSVDALSKLDSKTVTSIEFHCSHRVCNPYPYFLPRFTNVGAPILTWPRGFPLEFVNAARVGRRNVTRIDAAIVQSLADHDPDVDAVYRLTRRLPFFFSGSRSSAAVPSENYAPFNAQATLFTRDALWALLLPVTVHGRVSDIWRSFIIQRLFRDTGLRVAFAPPWVSQIRNAHNYLGDFQSENDLYLKSSEFIRVLDAWSSNSEALADRIQEVYIFLYEHGLLEVTDVLLAHAWVSDLISLGYLFPSVKHK